MEFDGICSNVRSRVGVVLISPSGEQFPFAYKLKFSNTNNIVEYEALLLRLIKARGMGIKPLKFLGDVKLIVKQV